MEAQWLLFRDVLTPRDVCLAKNGAESILCIDMTIGKQKTVFACLYIKHPFVPHVTFKQNMCTVIDRLLRQSSDKDAFW